MSACILMASLLLFPCDSHTYCESSSSVAPHVEAEVPALTCSQSRLSDPNARLNTLPRSKQLDPRWLHPCISDPMSDGAHVTLPSDHRSTGSLLVAVATRSMGTGARGYHFLTPYYPCKAHIDFGRQPSFEGRGGWRLTRTHPTVITSAVWRG